MGMNHSCSRTEQSMGDLANVNPHFLWLYDAAVWKLYSAGQWSRIPQCRIIIIIPCYCLQLFVHSGSSLEVHSCNDGVLDSHISQWHGDCRVFCDGKHFPVDKTPLSSHKLIFLVSAHCILQMVAWVWIWGINFGFHKLPLKLPLNSWLTPLGFGEHELTSEKVTSEWNFKINFSGQRYCVLFWRLPSKS